MIPEKLDRDKTFDRALKSEVMNIAPIRKRSQFKWRCVDLPLKPQWVRSEGYMFNKFDNNLQESQ